MGASCRLRAGWLWKIPEEYLGWGQRLGRHHRHLLVMLSVPLMVSLSLRGPGRFVTLVGQGLFDSASYPVRMILGTNEDSPTMPWNSSLEPGNGGACL